ncbi:MAG: tRNA epoxyqueuosine(34) reductase QueG [Bacteriovoracaceae bacterium]|nr:tRNA epoxyqueuosine(34) reductase QueG [Bacteriovoracaceae bacterium]
MSTPTFLAKSFLKNLGIVEWGYTEELDATTYVYYDNWVNEKKHLPLTYLEGERKEKRKKLDAYFQECESALVFLFPYHETKKYLAAHPQQFQMASYVLGFEGEDYHVVLKEKLKAMADKITEEIPTMKIKYSLDTQPILERDLAYRAGLGWFGKNSMLIHREHGSYFLIGSLLLSEKIKLPLKSISVDHCGTCRACIEACPTQAITEERTLIAQKCISTYTIEMFKPAPAPENFQAGANYIFGCDICQDVCPWNVKLLRATNSLGQMNEKIKNLVHFFLQKPLDEIIKKIQALSAREFKRKFKNTPLERTGKQGLLKNYQALKKD